MSMRISLPGVLGRTADLLDLHDMPDRAHMIRLLLEHLTEVRKDPARVGEFLELWADDRPDDAAVGEG